MNLTHKIKLHPTFKQRKYFACAAGTHRFVYNWALAEWNRQYASGDQPTGSKLKAQFNAIYRKEFPWVSLTHRDCHSQPFADLQKAFRGFLENRSSKPVFKSKNRNRRSFYVANDKFRVQGMRIILPRIGSVRMRERLRFSGKINSARIVEDSGEWFACISVEIESPNRSCRSESIIGVDLGVSALATFSTGEKIENIRPLRKAQRRLRRAQRKLSRRKKGSRNRNKQRLVVSRIHRRIRNVRRDGVHKLTSRLCKNHAKIVIEDLNVKGMMKNHCLAQSISDVGFGLFRQFLTYKAQVYGASIVVADRFFPSSKKCSSCGHVRDKLSLGDRIFACNCGLRIDRDLNAAINLRKLGEAFAEVTLAESLISDVEARTMPLVRIRAK